MTVLDEKRYRINQIDAELTKLFEERMKTVEEIAAWKMDNNMPLFDPSREENNIRRNTALLEDHHLAGYFELWYRFTMKISKDYQKDILSKHGKEGR